MKKIGESDFNKIVIKFGQFMKYCQRIKPEDNYLIVNRNSPILAEAAEQAAGQCKLNFRTFDLSASKPYKHFPKELRSLLLNKTPKAGVGLFDYGSHPDWNLKEVGARIELLYKIIEMVPISWAHSPGITVDMAVNGPLQCNYEKMAAEAEKMLKELQNVKRIHITAANGTDLDIKIPKEVKFDSDCIIVPPNVYGKPGKFGNLPVGEILLEKGKVVNVVNKETGREESQHYPVKLIANGKLVCDITAGGYSGRINPEKPIKVCFKEGALVDFQCDDPALDCIRKNILASEDKYGLATVLEEVGIGLNDKARITGNMLEDEKVRGTCHLAPANIRCHVDMLIDKPTIIVGFNKGRMKEIMKKGILI